MDIRNYWHQVKVKEGSRFCEGLKEIKIVPSDRYLENQDLSKEYYEVLMKEGEFPDKEYIISCMTGSGTLEEIEKFIEENFEEFKGELRTEDKILIVLDDLEEDRDFLKRSVIKKDNEIAIHIQDAIDLLNQMYRNEVHNEGKSSF